MVKKIIGTAITRVLNAILMLVVLVVATKNLGAEVYGSVTLIILAITIIGIVSNFIGGGAVVYFVPRSKVFLVWLPAFFWAFFSAIAGAIILSSIGKIPEGFTFHVMLLGLLQSLTIINQHVMLGKEKVGQFNLVSLLQVFVLLAVLAYLVFLAGEERVITYVKALYAGYGSGFVLSMVLVYKHLKLTDLQKAGTIVRKMMSYGWKAQMANLLQFFNYRLNFYILESFFNEAVLGVFSAGVRLSEGMWIIGKSVSMVQFSRTANSSDKDYVRRLNINLVKLTFSLTFIILIVVLLLPVDLFVYVFGSDFSQIKTVILTLAPGILVVPCSMLFSAYFSGTGKPHISMIGSGTGLIATLIIGFTIIPAYGLIAAGISASATYVLVGIYLSNRFMKISGSRPKEFLFRKSDWTFLKSELLKARKGS